MKAIFRNIGLRSEFIVDFLLKWFTSKGETLEWY